jgi:PleD family two-component response regulator
MATGSHESIIPETDLTPKGSDDPATRRTPAVLVVDSEAHRSAAIKAWAWQHRGVRALFATTSTAAYETASREQPEVAIINLMFRNGRGSTVGVELRRVAPEIEIVFVVEDPTVPEVQAAWDLGWDRLVSSEGLEAWLDRGLKPLAKFVRLKRQLTTVRQDTETASAGNVVPEVSNLPLNVAERRYRETFLRSKMATAGERRAAARLAGVPYTTFCVMLRKLGIKH